MNLIAQLIKAATRCVECHELLHATLKTASYNCETDSVFDVRWLDNAVDIITACEYC